MPGKRTGPGGNNLTSEQWAMVRRMSPQNQRKKKPDYSEKERRRRIAEFEKSLNAEFKKAGLPVKVK